MNFYRIWTAALCPFQITFYEGKNKVMQSRWAEESFQLVAWFIGASIIRELILYFKDYVVAIPILEAEAFSLFLSSVALLDIPSQMWQLTMAL